MVTGEKNSFYKPIFLLWVPVQLKSFALFSSAQVHLQIKKNREHDFKKWYKQKILLKKKFIRNLLKETNVQKIGLKSTNNIPL